MDKNNTWLQTVVWPLDVATGGWRCNHNNAVGEATFQALDGAVCASSVTGCTSAVAANGEGSISVSFAYTPSPPNRQGVDSTVQVCLHSVRQTGSCREEDSKMNDWFKKCYVKYPKQMFFLWLIPDLNVKDDPVLLLHVALEAIKVAV